MPHDWQDVTVNYSAAASLAGTGDAGAVGYTKAPPAEFPGR